MPNKVSRVIDGRDIARLRKLLETDRLDCNMWISFWVLGISIIYEYKKDP
jgi:hypothetical protein